jgi:hypothetical protein
MMSGYTWDCDVSVIIHSTAITMAFPKNHSTQQCVSFVERNLDALRSVVNGKLASGNAEGDGVDGGRKRAACLIEIDCTDLQRSRRWLAP